MGSKTKCCPFRIEGLTGLPLLEDFLIFQLGKLGLSFTVLSKTGFVRFSKNILLAHGRCLLG